MLIASLTFGPAPVYDQHSQALAVGNGVASPSDSHALRLLQEEAKPRAYDQHSREPAVGNGVAPSSDNHALRAESPEESSQLKKLADRIKQFALTIFPAAQEPPGKQVRGEGLEVREESLTPNTYDLTPGPQGLAAGLEQSEGFVGEVEFTLSDAVSDPTRGRLRRALRSLRRLEEALNRGAQLNVNQLRRLGEVLANANFSLSQNDGRWGGDLTDLGHYFLWKFHRMLPPSPYNRLMDHIFSLWKRLYGQEGFREAFADAEGQMVAGLYQTQTRARSRNGISWKDQVTQDGIVTVDFVPSYDDFKLIVSNTDNVMSTLRFDFGSADLENEGGMIISRSQRTQPRFPLLDPQRLRVVGLSLPLYVFDNWEQFPSWTSTQHHLAAFLWNQPHPAQLFVIQVDPLGTPLMRVYEGDQSELFSGDEEVSTKLAELGVVDGPSAAGLEGVELQLARWEWSVGARSAMVRADAIRQLSRIDQSGSSKRLPPAVVNRIRQAVVGDGKDSSVSVRQVVVQVLPSLDYPLPGKISDLLQVRVFDDNLPIRVKAESGLLTLAKQETSAVAQLLRGHTEPGGVPEMAAVASQLLSRVAALTPPAESKDTLSQLAGEDHPDETDEAVTTVAGGGSASTGESEGEPQSLPPERFNSAAVRELVARLDDSDPFVRARAIQVLGERGRDATPLIPRLLEMKVDSNSSHVQIALDSALQTLVQVRPEGIRHFYNVLNHQRPKVAAAAAHYMPAGDLDDALLKSKIGRVRIAAARGLGLKVPEIRGASAYELTVDEVERDLESASTDDDSSRRVQRAAAEALRQFRTSKQQAGLEEHEVPKEKALAALRESFGDAIEEEAIRTALVWKDIGEKGMATLEWVVFAHGGFEWEIYRTGDEDSIEWLEERLAPTGGDGEPTLYDMGEGRRLFFSLILMKYIVDAAARAGKIYRKPLGDRAVFSSLVSDAKSGEDFLERRELRLLAYRSQREAGQSGAVQGKEWLRVGSKQFRVDPAHGSSGTVLVTENAISRRRVLVNWLWRLAGGVGGGAVGYALGRSIEEKQERYPKRSDSTDDRRGGLIDILTGPRAIGTAVGALIGVGITGLATIVGRDPEPPSPDASSKDAKPPPAAGLEEVLDVVTQLNSLAFLLRERVQDEGKKLEAALKQIFDEDEWEAFPKVGSESSDEMLDDLFYILFGERGISLDEELARRYVQSQDAIENLRVLPFVTQAVLKRLHDGDPVSAPLGLVFDLEMEARSSTDTSKLEALIKRVYGVFEIPTAGLEEEEINYVLIIGSDLEKRDPVQEIAEEVFPWATITFLELPLDSAWGTETSLIDLVILSEFDKDAKEKLAGSTITRVIAPDEWEFELPAYELRETLEAFLGGPTAGLEEEKIIELDRFTEFPRVPISYRQESRALALPLRGEEWFLFPTDVLAHFGKQGRPVLLGSAFPVLIRWNAKGFLELVQERPKRIFRRSRDIVRQIRPGVTILVGLDPDPENYPAPVETFAIDIGEQTFLQMLERSNLAIRLTPKGLLLQDTGISRMRSLLMERDIRGFSGAYWEVPPGQRLEFPLREIVSGVTGIFRFGVERELDVYARIEASETAPLRVVNPATELSQDLRFGNWISMGRAPGADLLFEHEQVSRIHAFVSIQEKGQLLPDVGPVLVIQDGDGHGAQSSNGTYIKWVTVAPEEPAAGLEEAAVITGTEAIAEALRRATYTLGQGVLPPERRLGGRAGGANRVIALYEDLDEATTVVASDASSPSAPGVELLTMPQRASMLHPFIPSPRTFGRERYVVRIKTEAYRDFMRERSGEAMIPVRDLIQQERVGEARMASGGDQSAFVQELLQATRRLLEYPDVQSRDLSGRMEHWRSAEADLFPALEETVQGQERAYTGLLDTLHEMGDQLEGQVSGGTVSHQQAADALGPMLQRLEAWPRFRLALEDIQSDLLARPRDQITLQEFTQTFPPLLKGILQRGRFNVMRQFPLPQMPPVYYDLTRTALLDRLAFLERQLVSEGAGDALPAAVVLEEAVGLARRTYDLEREQAFTELVEREVAELDAKAPDQTIPDYPIHGGGLLILDAQGQPKGYLPGWGVSTPQEFSPRYLAHRVAKLLEPLIEPGDRIVLVYPSFTGNPGAEQVAVFLEDIYMLRQVLPEGITFALGTAADQEAEGAAPLRVFVPALNESNWQHDWIRAGNQVASRVEEMRAFYNRLNAENLVDIGTNIRWYKWSQDPTSAPEHVRDQLPEASRIVQDIQARVLALALGIENYLQGATSEGGRIYAQVGQPFVAQISALSSRYDPLAINRELFVVVHQMTVRVSEAMTETLISGGAPLLRPYYVSGLTDMSVLEVQVKKLVDLRRRLKPRPASAAEVEPFARWWVATRTNAGQSTHHQQFPPAWAAFQDELLQAEEGLTALAASPPDEVRVVAQAVDWGRSILAKVGPQGETIRQTVETLSGHLDLLKTEGDLAIRIPAMVDRLQELSTLVADEASVDQEVLEDELARLTETHGMLGKLDPQRHRDQRQPLLEAARPLAEAFAKHLVAHLDETDPGRKQEDSGVLLAQAVEVTAQFSQASQVLQSFDDLWGKSPTQKEAARILGESDYQPFLDPKGSNRQLVRFLNFVKQRGSHDDPEKIQRVAKAKVSRGETIQERQLYQAISKLAEAVSSQQAGLEEGVLLREVPRALEPVFTLEELNALGGRLRETAPKIRQNTVVFLEEGFFDAATLGELDELRLLGMAIDLKERLPWPKELSVDLQIVVIPENSVSKERFRNLYAGWRVVEVVRIGSDAGFLPVAAVPVIVSKALAQTALLFEVAVTDYLGLWELTFEEVMEALEVIFAA